MKIGSKERLATALLLAVIGVIALAVGRTEAEVGAAWREETHAEEIARTLNHLRLVTFEFALHGHDRARMQWHAVSQRLDALVAEARFTDPEQQELLSAMRQRRSQAQRSFGELAAARAEERGDDAVTARGGRFEAQLLSRLFIDQQDNLAAASRLGDLARERSHAAQRREIVVIFAGLTLIALIKIAVSWLIRRDVLEPVAQLQRAAEQVAAGKRDVEFATYGDNEVGELARDLGRMTASLRDSLAGLERGNLELAAANQELEAFSYSVSHDLRAPLRAIDGFSQALLEDCHDRLDDDGKDYLGRVRGAARRMGELIDEMLKLSRSTRGEIDIGLVDLSALAESAVADLCLAQPDREVIVSIAPGVSGRGDVRLLRSVLENLLSNAWKFTGKTAAPRIEFVAERRAGELICHVRDNGAGFDMAHAGMLFGPFQRLHQVQEFPGNGVGLASVKRVMARLGGRVWAEGAVGRGATFSFALPDTSATAG